jgi:hypothetical protein
MTTQQQQIAQIVRRDRWRIAGWSCLGIGAFLLISLVSAFGFGGAGNPKSTTSVYSAFVVAGLFQSQVAPLLILGISAAVAGGVILMLARK